MKACILFCLLLLTPSLPAQAGAIDQAIQLYQRGQFQKAVDLLSEWSQSSPEDAEVRLWLGKSLLKAQRWDDAIRQMEKAAELAPNNGAYYLWLGRTYGAKASHASFLTAIGWTKKVVETYEIARKLAPNNIDIRFDLLSFYLHAPAVVGGGQDRAEAEAAAIANLDPKEGYAARAFILEKGKKWDRALSELVQATLQFPGRADSFMDLADFLLQRHHFEGAATNARKALSLDANLLKAKLILAAAQIMLGKDIAEAESSLKSMAQGPLTDNDPAFEEVYYWLGQAYLAEGKKLQAREAFSTALRYDPDYERAKNGLSQAR
jgi:tetratricopeptide (TPR) repeat protein